MEKVAVVIPLYQTKLNPQEEVSLRQCVRILGKHPIIFVAPESLDLSFLSSFGITPKTIRFKDEYFKSTKTYNKLLTSTIFYEAFANYEYILIYQLDAYVFEDRLLDWCAKGYDYIGAPKLRKHHLAGKASCSPVLFNGGLSLRRVKPLLRYIKIYQLFFNEWLANEDAMFSFAQRRARPFRFLLRLPEWKEALSFAIEQNPKISFELLGDLPFGCHAWERYNPTFWKQFIPQQEN
jgi:Protein of unknown function (DUF5672)